MYIDVQYLDNLAFSKWLMKKQKISMFAKGQIHQNIDIF